MVRVSSTSTPSSSISESSEFHDKEVNLYILAGHENMQL